MALFPRARRLIDSAETGGTFPVADGVSPERCWCALQLAERASLATAYWDRGLPVDCAAGAA
jgi:hypothetical protein